MGCGSSKIYDGLGADLSCPNMNYMKRNYGNSSISQISIWIDDRGFPKEGSFSLKQLRTLKLNLTQKEEETKDCLLK